MLKYIDNLKKISSKIDKKIIEKIVYLVDKTIKKKKVIFICGNGGSSAIASHALCDWSKRLQKFHNIKIIDLTSNKSLISAISNDSSHDFIFSKQLEIYSSEGDICIFISSSGNSNNIIKGIKLAKQKKVKSSSIVGFDGGRAKKLSDHVVHFETNIYEYHEDLSQILINIIYQKLLSKYKNE